MPKKPDLPDSVAILADHNAAIVRSDPDFDHDMADLIATLAKVLPNARPDSASKVLEFHDQTSGELLRSRPLAQGRFEFVDQSTSVASVLFSMITFETHVSWPPSAEAMWRACVRIVPQTERSLTHKGGDGRHGSAEFLFSSSVFRVKCAYRFWNTLTSGNSSDGTMIISSRESGIIDALQDAYVTERAKMS